MSRQGTGAAAAGPDREVADMLSGPRSGSDLQTEAGLLDVLHFEASLCQWVLCPKVSWRQYPPRMALEGSLANWPTGPDPSTNL